MKIDANKIVQAIVIALLFAIANKAWSTYEEVIKLRMDLDNLYSLVDDVAKR